MASRDFRSELVGSFSEGSNGNPTVAMIEAAFRHHGLNWRYVNCEVPPEMLADAVKGARAMGWRGFNLSIPHKVAVIPLLDGLGESAAIMGAVNCGVNRDGRFIGENTDGKGFLKSLQEVVDPQGRSIVMFGAGGAARRGSQGREPLAHADVAGADACEGWRKERKRARSFSVFALALVLWIASSRSLFTFLSFSLFFSASYRHVNDAVKQVPRLRIWLFEACFEEEKRVPSNC